MHRINKSLVAIATCYVSGCSSEKAESSITVVVDSPVDYNHACLETLDLLSDVYNVTGATGANASMWCRDIKVSADAAFSLTARDHDLDGEDEVVLMLYTLIFPVAYFKDDSAIEQMGAYKSYFVQKYGQETADDIVSEFFDRVEYPIVD